MLEDLLFVGKGDYSVCSGQFGTFSARVMSLVLQCRFSRLSIQVLKHLSLFSSLYLYCVTSNVIVSCRLSPSITVIVVVVVIIIGHEKHSKFGSLLCKLFACQLT